MGNQRNLVRTLGMGYVVIFVIANIIGSGVYKKIAPMAAELHSSGWILAAWIVGGIITLFGALSNAEVAGLLADTGGEFVYLKKIYNRFFAFMYGWSLFTVIQTATISSLAYVFAQSLNSIIHIPQIFHFFAPFYDRRCIFPIPGFRSQADCNSADPGIDRTEYGRIKKRSWCKQGHHVAGIHRPFCNCRFWSLRHRHPDRQMLWILKS